MQMEQLVPCPRTKNMFQMGVVPAGTPQENNSRTRPLGMSLENKKPLKTVRPDCKALTQILFMVIYTLTHI